MIKYYIREIEEDIKHPAMTCIHKQLEDGGWKVFSEDEDNPDYQAYLVWVSEGNTAEIWDWEVMSDGN